MPSTDLKTKAIAFRDLNLAGGLILPNAWDAASARVLELAGFPAIATASAAIAFARGFADGERIGRDRMLSEIRLVASRVAIPVSADIEAGYGPTTADIEATVEGVIAAGAVGVNLEDARPEGGAEPLFSLMAASSRVAAARTVADRRGLALTINARTDVFLLGLGDSNADRLAIAVERGRAYLAAGADIVFVPGQLDPTMVRQIADGIGGPVSLLAGPGAPPAAELFAAGAHRISLGPHLMLSTLGHLRTVAGGIRDHGRFDAFSSDHVPFDEANAIFAVGTDG